jgi:hypothetical protein
MTTFKQALAADFAAVFANPDENGELAVYTSPAGVQTADVPVVAAVQSFINEMANTAGLGGTIVIGRAKVSAPAIHGKITIAAGVFVITQIVSIDDDTVTVAAMADMRISPAGMRQ